MIAQLAAYERNSLRRATSTQAAATPYGDFLDATGPIPGRGAHVSQAAWYAAFLQDPAAVQADRHTLAGMRFFLSGVQGCLESAGGTYTAMLDSDLGQEVAYRVVEAPTLGYESMWQPMSEYAPSASEGPLDATHWSLDRQARLLQLILVSAAQLAAEGLWHRPDADEAYRLADYDKWLLRVGSPGELGGCRSAFDAAASRISQNDGQQFAEVWLAQLPVQLSAALPGLLAQAADSRPQLCSDAASPADCSGFDKAMRALADISRALLGMESLALLETLPAATLRSYADVVTLTARAGSIIEYLGTEVQRLHGAGEVSPHWSELSLAFSEIADAFRAQLMRAFVS